MLPGLEHAEAVGAGDQQVVAAVAVEVGDVHAREVDRADEQLPLGRYTPSLSERNKSDLLVRSSRTISLVPSPSVSSAAAPRIWAELRPALYWSLIFQWPSASSEIRRAKVFWATIIAGPSRFIRLTPAGVALESGPRLPENGRGGSPFLPRSKSGDP